MKSVVLAGFAAVAQVATSNGRNVRFAGECGPMHEQVFGDRYSSRDTINEYHEAYYCSVLRDGDPSSFTCHSSCRSPSVSCGGFNIGLPGTHEWDNIHSCGGGRRYATCFYRCPAKYWSKTESISEENGRVKHNFPPYLVDGITCEGQYCDNKVLHLQDDVVVPSRCKLAYGRDVSTPWISEEGTSRARCPEGMVAKDIQCEGRFCDRVRLVCARFMDHRDGPDTCYVPDEARIHTTRPIGRGLAKCAERYAVVGIGCHGPFCESISLMCQEYMYQTKAPTPRPTIPRRTLPPAFRPPVFRPGNRFQQPIG